MFDATLNVVDSAVIVAESPDGEQPTHAQLVLVVGIVLPIAPQPGAPPIIAPGGALRVPMTKDGLTELIDAATQAREKLADTKKQSDLIIPSNLDGVDQLAAERDRLRGS